jgi:hypothetical protein
VKKTIIIHPQEIIGRIHDEAALIIMKNIGKKTELSGLLIAMYLSLKLEKEGEKVL